MKRPAPYVPLSVTFATGRTGTAIIDRYGLEGLGVWAAMMAGAKAGHPEGQIRFLHEEHWAAIGLETCPPSFTLKEFLTFLGKRKQTRKTTHGRVIYVELTRWGDWNDEKNSYLASQRSARYRAQKKRDGDRDDAVTQSERDRDTEKRRQEKTREEKKTLAAADPPRKPEPKTPRPRDELWDALAEALGQPTTRSERGRRNKAVKELREIGATPTEITNAARRYKLEWPDIALTDTALAANWSRFKNGGPGETSAERFARRIAEHNAKEHDERPE